LPPLNKMPWLTDYSKGLENDGRNVSVKINTVQVIRVEHLCPILLQELFHGNNDCISHAGDPSLGPNNNYVSLLRALSLRIIHADFSHPSQTKRTQLTTKRNALKAVFLGNRQSKELLIFVTLINIPQKSIYLVVTSDFWTTFGLHSILDIFIA
jgi:hypothetical protein